MATVIKNQIVNLIFPNTEELKDPSILLDFSEAYKEELKLIIQYLKQNDGKWVPLFFTRILPNGKMQEPQELLGVPKNTSEKSFHFYSSYNISARMLTDEEIKNEIILGNVLGALPTFGTSSLDQILVTKDTEIAKNYFDFWEKTKKTLDNFLNRPHHVKIYLSNNMIVEGEVLEINKSNILIYSKMERKNELQNGSYVYANTIPHERFLYFISSEYFITNIKILPWKEHINPYDD